MIVVGMIVLLMWQFIPKAPEPAPLPEDVVNDQADGKFIRISSASWALNCLEYRKNEPTYSADEDKRLPIRRDNVLVKVSKLCNGKNTCEVTNSASGLGASGDRNPDKDCQKQLEIEYRCLTFDRPIRKTAKERDKIEIRCEEEPETAPGEAE